MNYYEEMSSLDNAVNQMLGLITILSPAGGEHQLEFPKHAERIKLYRAAGDVLMDLVTRLGVSSKGKEYYFRNCSREIIHAKGPNGIVDILVVKPFCSHCGLLPLVVYFHGGGMVMGKPEEAPMIEIAAQTGAVVASVDYRLAPENPFPKGISDCYFALQYLVTNAKYLGADRKRVAVAGLSAGGLMTAIVASIATNGWPEKPETKLRSPLVAQLMIQPMVNHHGGGYPSYSKFGTVGGLSSLRIQWFWNQYLPYPRNCTTYACDPLLQSAKELERLPPLVLVTGTADALQDEGKQYGDILHNAGVQVSHFECFGSHIGCTLFRTQEMKNAVSVLNSHLIKAF